MNACEKAVLISHNHYDHLDATSVQKLHEKFGSALKWLTGAGNGEWLKANSIDAANIVELNWWQQAEVLNSKLQKLTIVFTPAQHWSGRGVFDKNKSLWGGWVILGTKRVYFAGDSGN